MLLKRAEYEMCLGIGNCVRNNWPIGIVGLRFWHCTSSSNGRNANSCPNSNANANSGND
jgi:hypothetical protein